jgi:glycosyltransferase involved in cell wall biosynthesis
MTRVSCVIPAFNAAETLAPVARSVRERLPDAVVVVVDDGSSDGTSAVALRCADVVVRHAVNRGKGAALRTGIARALSAGCDLVLTIDADGQHPAELVPALLEAAASAHVVVGARARRGTSMPLQRRVTNWLSSAALSALAGCSIPDSQSGFRVIRREVLERIEPMGDRYDFEAELLVRAAREGYRIASVRVPTVYSGASHFRPVRDSVSLIRTMVRLSRGRSP